jgi:hypothetical protein
MIHQLVMHLDCFSNIPLQTVTSATRESSAVVPGDQQQLPDAKYQVLSPVAQADDDVDVILSTDVPVVLSRKDAVYRGSLHNIPLYNEDTEEYHNQMVTTTSDVLNKPQTKKSFLAQVAAQIDLNLLKDAAFALFAISNFLTSLGFNVPYNFANDLATDAKVVEERRRWVIMTIGIANCFGRVFIGLLGDQKWVS